MILATALLAFAAHPAPLRVSELERAFEVRVALGKSGCTVAFNGRRFDQQGYAEELLAYVRRRAATRAVVRIDKSVPSHCSAEVTSFLNKAAVIVTPVDQPRRP